ncbi:MAG: PVC-type heme-binding CxxCH protein [Gemmatimonadales bacterium]
MTLRPLSRFAPLALAMTAACTTPPLELEEGDHIVIIGNTLAERMQHDGWLETYLQLARPALGLVVRDQGFAGDRIDHRPRTKGLPSPDDYLGLSKASVVFAMFGYNESYDDDPEGFATDLATWIDHTRAQNYSGQGAPRIVLFSPIAHEDLDDPNLPDGSANNGRLAKYTRVMDSVSRLKGVGYLDLFGPSQRLYGESAAPLTINGIHLNELGNRRIAEVIVRGLLGSSPSGDAPRVEAVRAAVLEKNRYWFNRFRATDGNDVWGSRATLAFVGGQTNYDVLQNELVQFDHLTANRDVVIWAAARGESVAPDDSNVPPPVPVVSNLAEPQLQGGVSKVGTLDYLGGEAAIAKMRLERGMKANLFASEERFPELVNPVQLGVDTRGRLWVATWGTYPKWEPTGTMNDRLLILPDDDRDGVADTAITFAYVQNPTAFEFWNGGVIVASQPDFLFLKDTDGDNVADVRFRIAGAFGSADTHHAANNFVYGPDGFIYYQEGVFSISNVETPWAANQESNRSAMYRFNPRTHEFSFHADNSPNPHGTAFDYWGYHYATDATGGTAYQVKDNPDGTFAMRQMLQHTVRPVPSSGILSSGHFPAKNQGNFLILNVIAFLGIKQYSLSFDPATGNVNGTETDDLLVSSDPNFRPTDFEIGDDGGLYVADWSNAIIGHMQHNIRDPARDHTHGRLYRITVPGRPLSEHVAIDGQPIPALLAALEHPINGIRHRARIELSERPTTEVITATRAWLKRFDPASQADAHHLLEALWVHQQHNVVDRDLLALVLKSPVPHARIAARRVERMWEHGAARPVAVGAVAAPDPPSGADAIDDGVIVVRAVVETMRYDREAFTVTAGRPVTLRFVNDDYAPHNLIIGTPGSAEEIGAAADRLGSDGFAQAFRPKTDKILVATDLLNHQKSQVVEFRAPGAPGDYVVLCTFPGHRQTMRAVMRVVK